MRQRGEKHHGLHDRGTPSEPGHGARLRFALKEVLPIANRLDPEKANMPLEPIQKLADMGYFGIVIPEEYGAA